jgi:hypothetical protein
MREFQSAALLDDLISSVHALYWYSAYRDNQSRYFITENIHVIESDEVCLGHFHARFAIERIYGMEIS